jgi:hypothetical protein
MSRLSRQVVILSIPDNIFETRLDNLGAAIQFFCSKALEKVPEDSEIVAIRHSFERGSLDLSIWSEHLQAVPEGFEAPRIVL